MGISLTTGNRNIPQHCFLSSMTVYLQITLALEKFFIQELIEVSQSARHSRVRFRRRLSSVGPTVVFKLVTIEQANDYLMVYCRTGPTISTRIT